MNKTLIYLSFIIPVLALFSCNESTGYLDYGQNNRIALLTGSEWLVESVESDYFDKEVFNDTTQLYRFERNKKGWFATASFTEPEMKENICYFQWDFTNEQFAVICLSGTVEGHWMIERLTSTELWVTESRRDPALYPNDDSKTIRFKARKPLQ